MYLFHGLDCERLPFSENKKTNAVFLPFVSPITEETTAEFSLYPHLSLYFVTYKLMLRKNLKKRLHHYQTMSQCWLQFVYYSGSYLGLWLLSISLCSWSGNGCHAEELDVTRELEEVQIYVQESGRKFQNDYAFYEEAGLTF